MNKKWINSAIAAAMTFGLVSIQAPVIKAAEGDFDLTIMHTNDTHANLKDVAKRASLVKTIRGEKTNSLLLDAGDVFSGTLYFNEFNGQADLDLMNYMGYDAMTFGNHEFDRGDTEDGHKSLSEFVKGAKFPLVSSNVDFSADLFFEGIQMNSYEENFENGKIYNGIVKNFNGEKVGIFGLTTEETVTISSPADVTFKDYIASAKAAVAAFEAQGINKIIAISHIGYDDSADVDNDLLLAENVEGIDVIVGGHSHSKMTEPKIANNFGAPTVIVQAGQYGENLGQLDVTFDINGEISAQAGKLLPVKDVIEGDAEAAAILKPYSDQIVERMAESTGVSTEVYLNGSRGLWGVRAGETNLGNLITDGMLATAKKIDSDTVIAIQNGGGIRASIEAGDITYGEVLTVMPFGNSLGILNLSGSEILAALEHSLKEFPKENGGFLHMSGMSVAFDGTAEVGNRVLEVYVGEEQLELNKMYKVATNTFTAKGGDGYTMFANAYAEGRLSEPGNIDYEMFIDYMKTLDKVEPMVEDRIFAVIPFKDVAYESWYFAYVQDLFYQGLINGKSETTFEPKSNLTRAQAVSLIVRGLGLETEEKSPFTDISGYDATTQAEIDAAYAAEIVFGIEGKFMPGSKVTRAQFALMLSRAYNAVSVEPYVNEFESTYTDLGNYNEETKYAIQMLNELEIAQGENGKFMPLNYASRAHASKMISNFLFHME